MLRILTNFDYFVRFIVLQRMANKYEGNFLISPLSAKCALILLYEGAQDETANQLASVMNLPAGRWDTREKFRVILRSLKVGAYEIFIPAAIVNNFFYSHLPIKPSRIIWVFFDPGGKFFSKILF